MSKRPWFPFFAFDWVADIYVTCMSATQKGCYIQLLAWQWIEGALPNDTMILANLCRIPLEEFEADIWPTLQRHFPEVKDEKGKLRNPKLESEKNWEPESEKEEALSPDDERKERRRAASAKANKKRWDDYRARQAEAESESPDSPTGAIGEESENNRSPIGGQSESESESVRGELLKEGGQSLSQSQSQSQSQGDTPPNPQGGSESANPRKGKTLLPKDWEPKEPGIAEENGLPLKIALPQFKDWAHGSGKMMKDWDATWRTACRGWLKKNLGAMQGSPMEDEEKRAAEERAKRIVSRYVTEA